MVKRSIHEDTKLSIAPTCTPSVDLMEVIICVTMVSRCGAMSAFNRVDSAANRPYLEHHVQNHANKPANDIKALMFTLHVDGLTLMCCAVIFYCNIKKLFYALLALMNLNLTTYYF